MYPPIYIRGRTIIKSQGGMTMDFIRRVQNFVQEAEPNLQHITNEDATKLALVFPFLRVLGYNTTNPAEVMPEYTADVGTKQGEKVDIAIQMNDEPVILIEVKTYGTSQLT